MYTLTSAGGLPCMNLNESLLLKCQSVSEYDFVRNPRDCVCIGHLFAGIESHVVLVLEDDSRIMVPFDAICNE